MKDHQSKSHHEPVGYWVYILIWLALLTFTGLTVAVAGVDLRQFTIITALVIATIKTTLVVAFFMHLKYDQPVFKIMLVVVMMTIAVILALTFSDYTGRGTSLAEYSAWDLVVNLFK